MADEKWIIFDFDGTLANTLEAGLLIVNALADRFGYKKISSEEAKRLQGMAPKEILKEVEIPLWKLPFIARAVRKQLAAQMSFLDLYPGILVALQNLKNQNCRLAILTTGSLENANVFLRQRQLENFFEFVHAESNLFGKGRILKKLLKKYGIRPECAIYVGDEVRDIDAARQAGVKSAGVVWGVNSKEALAKQRPDWLVEKPEQLLEIIV
jgi:phosphoglycolate phosphatase